MKFSVIIPAFNSALFVAKAIQSVIDQTLRDFQIIVVDDGSTDNTAAIVLDFARADPRVTLLTHSFSRGPSAARNTAIEHASGDWLALLDSDDEFLPSRLETLSTLAEARGLDAIADGITLVDFATRSSRGAAFDPAWLSTSSPITLTYMISRDWPGKYYHWSFGTMKPIFRRELVIDNNIRYDEDIRLGEDLLFYSDLILTGCRFGVTSSCLYRYSIRDSSISAKPKPTTQLIEVNSRIMHRLRTATNTLPDSKSLPNLLKSREYALWFQVFTWYLRLGMFKEAFGASKHISTIFIVQQGCRRVLRRFKRK